MEHKNVFLNAFKLGGDSHGSKLLICWAKPAAWYDINEFGRISIQVFVAQGKGSIWSVSRDLNFGSFISNSPKNCTSQMKP